MRIARFQAADGRVLSGRLIDDRTANPTVGDSIETLEFSAERVEIGQLLAPVTPPNIFAIGRNYRAHAAETGSQVPEAPLIFIKATTSLLDPGGTIQIPRAAPS